MFTNPIFDVIGARPATQRIFSPDDARRRLRNVGKRNPTDAEINDWLLLHNSPLVGNAQFRNMDLPGVTSTYHSSIFDNAASPSNIMILFFMLILGGLFYKQRKKKNTDDEFVKTDDNGLAASLYNPFNRR